MSFLDTLALLTTKFFYTLTFRGCLWVFLLPSDYSSSLFLADSLSNICTRMLITELFFHKKFYFFFLLFVFLTKENVYSSYSSSDSALDSPSLGRPLLWWRLSWVPLTSSPVTPVRAFVTWNSQCLLSGVCSLEVIWKLTYVFYLSFSSPSIIVSTT